MPRTEERKIKMITWDIQHKYKGKFLNPGYDWAKDPKHLKTNGTIPHNRCFHCGHRFVGSEIAAFCNICDHAMAIGGEDMLMGFSFERRDSRIRIPEDMDEKSYIAKVQSMPDPKPDGPSFMRAEDLV